MVRKPAAGMAILHSLSRRGHAVPIHAADVGVLRPHGRQARTGEIATGSSGDMTSGCRASSYRKTPTIARKKRRVCKEAETRRRCVGVIESSDLKVGTDAQLRQSHAT